MSYSTSEKEFHDQMLRVWMNDLHGSGNVVNGVALTNYTQPNQIGGSVPDLTAKTPAGEWLIGEVKTCGDIDNDHTRGQLKDYLTRQAKVMLLVPKSCHEIARQTLAKWNYPSVEVWTYSGS